VIEYQEHDRERAVRDILAILRHPLAVMSVPDREVAYALATYHTITTHDLLDAAVARARNR
jgi:hypothetical protein